MDAYRELGIVTDVAVRRPGVVCGHLVASKDALSLPFSIRGSSGSFCNGDKITFERGSALAGPVATAVLRFKGLEYEPEFLQSMGSSVLPTFWQQVAPAYLETLSVSEQVTWLRTRSDAIHCLSPSAWDAVVSEAVHAPGVWELCPPRTRVRALKQAAEYLATLTTEEQLTWVKQREPLLDHVPCEAWSALTYRCLQHADFWRVAPEAAQALGLRLAPPYLVTLTTAEQVEWLTLRRACLDKLSAGAWIALKPQVLHAWEIWQIAPPVGRRVMLEQAAAYLSTIESDLQIKWVTERLPDSPQLSGSVWESLAPRAMRHPGIWPNAPEQMRARASFNLVRLFEEQFLEARKAYEMDQMLLPPEEDFQELKIEFVTTWAAQHLGLQLNAEQATAVSELDGDVQVVARAGSGKTRTLVTRAIFLQSHCGVKPAEILILAFNRKAAEEVRNRLRREFSDHIPHVMTFHALAYAIVHPEEALLFDDEVNQRTDQSVLVQDVIDEHIRSESYGPRIKDLMLYHFQEDWERIEDGKFVLPQAEFLEYRRSLPRLTLSGHQVKSFGEKLIANTLFENDVEFKYEPNFFWKGTNYRPDFVIGDLKKGGVVVEYFGLQGDPDYDEQSEAKRLYWRTKPEWQLLEFTPSDITSDGSKAFSLKLLESLRQAGISTRLLSEEEIWKRIKDRAITTFTTAMKNFLVRCRIQGLSKDQLHDCVREHVCCTRAEGEFLHVAEPIFNGYVRRLTEHEREDFAGLMWRATQIVLGGGAHFARDRNREQGDLRWLRYVMVDEFQDFSAMFASLVFAIRDVNPKAELFCVGDDWQSINGFAGSDLRYFHDFSSIFRDTKQVALSTNWRSARAIVHAGNMLMRGLGEPAKPKEGADAGQCLTADLDLFWPSATEKEQFDCDDETAATLRVVIESLRRRRDVVLLTRKKEALRRDVDDHGAPQLLEQIRSFLPESDRARVTGSTVHGYKGLEQGTVIIRDALERIFPLVHPNWVFLRIFGESINRIVEEERRLFYVALTRAEHQVVIFTRKEMKSQFLEGTEATPINWQDFPSVSNDSRVEVRAYKSYVVRDQLKALGYRYDKVGEYWFKLVPREGFNFEEHILTQPWCHSPVYVQVYAGEKLEHWWPKY